MTTETCCICLEDLEDTNITTLGCGHKLHINCFLSLILKKDEGNNNDLCPLCRGDIKLEDETMAQIMNLNISKDFMINKNNYMFVAGLGHKIISVLTDNKDESMAPSYIRRLITEKYEETYTESKIRAQCKILEDGDRITLDRIGRSNAYCVNLNWGF